MSYENKYKDWKERVISASKITKSASEASSILGIKYDTYKRYAIKYGCFTTNQCGKGISKPNNSGYNLNDILNGKYPQYQTFKLKNRLLKEKMLKPICNNCTLSNWLGKAIPLELHHIDGNNNNHLLDNLELLCPNCHTLTDSYRGKNKKI